jgi:ubiquitin fusion degradation protein 1
MSQPNDNSQYKNEQNPSRKIDLNNLFIEVYLANSAQTIRREDIELTNSIVLPPSALEKLSKLNNFWDNKNPILFRILNIDLNIETYCGVIDFTAPEGQCYIPSNMFERLCLEEGQMINLLKLNSLPRGSFIKFQPYQTEFIKNPNHIEILENNLRNYFCMTEGDTISVKYENKIYKFDVIKCKPAKAIQIIDSDLIIDLAPPKDNKEH